MLTTSHHDQCDPWFQSLLVFQNEPTWWSITNDLPQQKPPTDAREFSMLALMRSISSICQESGTAVVIPQFKKKLKTDIQPADKGSH